MIDAMKKGLEALEELMPTGPATAELRTNAITALHQAIAEAEKEAALQEISDIGQWDTSDMAHRTGGFSVEQEPVAWIYNGNLHAFDPTDWAAEPKNIQPLYLAPPKREIEQEPESWMGVSDNPYCNDSDCNDPNSRAMRWHNKLLELRKQVALDGLAETSREIEQEPAGVIKTIGGYPDQSEHTVKWNVPHKDLKDGQPVYTSPPKPQNELDIAERAYFAGKEAGIAVGEAETKHFEDLAEYRLQLLMKIPEQAEQAPLAWVKQDVWKGQFMPSTMLPRKIWWECEKNIGFPIYTAPVKREQESVGCDCIQGQVCHICDPILPAWVSLTDEDIKTAIIDDPKYGFAFINLVRNGVTVDEVRTVINGLARVVEAKLKELNQ
jgi:hypothetical protein